MKKFFRWLKGLFKGVSHVLESNRVLARATIKLSLGAVLEHNKGSAPEVLRALKGLYDLIAEGKISSNDELRKETHAIVADKFSNPYLAASVEEAIGAVCTAIDDWVGLSPGQYRDIWLDVVMAGVEMAECYVNYQK